MSTIVMVMGIWLTFGGTAMLRRHEWIAQYGECPDCGAIDKHFSYCKLTALLKEEKPCK